MPLASLTPMQGVREGVDEGGPQQRGEGRKVKAN